MCVYIYIHISYICIYMYLYIYIFIHIFNIGTAPPLEPVVRKQHKKLQALLVHTARYIAEFDKPPRLLSFTVLLSSLPSPFPKSLPPPSPPPFSFSLCLRLSPSPFSPPMLPCRDTSVTHCPMAAMCVGNEGKRARATATTRARGSEHVCERERERETGREVLLLQRARCFSCSLARTVAGE